MKKKHFFIWILVFLTLSGVFSFALPQALSKIFLKSLKETLPDSELSFKSLKITPQTIRVLDLRIQNKDLTLDHADLTISFRILELLQGHLQKICVENASILIKQSLPSVWSSASSDASRSGRSSITLDSFEIKNLVFEIEQNDVRINGSLDTLWNLKEQTPISIRLLLHEAQSRVFLAKNLLFSWDLKTGKGAFLIEEIRLQKLKITQIKAPVFFNGNEFLFSPLQALSLKATLLGTLQIILDNDLAFDLNLKVTHLSLTALMEEFEFQDKMSLSGDLSGQIEIRGGKKGVEFIHGAFEAPNGGNLVIQDQAFLQSIALRMHQPLVLVESGLKEYHYDSGSLKLSKNGGDLDLAVHMDGPQGKRELETVFHDVL